MSSLPHHRRLQRRLHRRAVRGVPPRSVVGRRVAGASSSALAESRWRRPRRRRGGVRSRRSCARPPARRRSSSAIRGTATSPSQLDPLGTTPPGARGADARVPRHHRGGSRGRPGGRARLRRRVTRGRRRRSSCASATAARSASSSTTSATTTEREWFRQTIESGEATTPLTADEKKALLERLTRGRRARAVPRHARIVSVKRFSIEGVDALVPMLDEAIARGARRRRAAGRHRHGAPRPAQRARARDGQAVSRRCSASSRGSTPTRTPTATRAT